MKFFTLLAVSMLLLTSPVKAEIEVYNFDKAHTQILFFVNHLGFSNSQGEFHDYDGSFEFNPSDPEYSKVEVVIKTASIDMDDEKWNAHMRNKDFFNVEEFPTMTFKSTKIEKIDNKKGQLTGDLTLLGVTKPVTLDVIFNKAGVHTFNQKYVAGFSAKTTIKRSDFGMKYGLPLIGNDVNIMIEVEGIRQNGDVVNN